MLGMTGLDGVAQEMEALKIDDLEIVFLKIHDQETGLQRTAQEVAVQVMVFVLMALFLGVDQKSLPP
jgi:hypothetical protein